MDSSSENSPKHLELRIRNKSSTSSNTIYEDSELFNMLSPSLSTKPNAISKSILGKLMNTDDIITVRSEKKLGVSPTIQLPSEQIKNNDQPLSPTSQKRNSTSSNFPPVSFSPRLSAQQQRLLLTTPKTHLKFPSNSYLSKSTAPPLISKIPSGIYQIYFFII